MKVEELGPLVDAINELSESHADLAQALRETTREARVTKQLWRNSKRSWLMKVGLALIAFPDPTISDIVGSLMVAAGLVQARALKRSRVRSEKCALREKASAPSLFAAEILYLRHMYKHIMFRVIG